MTGLSPSRGETQFAQAFTATISRGPARGLGMKRVIVAAQADLVCQYRLFILHFTDGRTDA